MPRIRTPPGGRPPLTRRQREIVALLVEGFTVREIAERLGRSRSTVYEHLDNIRDQLGLRTHAEIAVWSVRHQAIESHEPTIRRADAPHCPKMRRKP